MAAMARDGSWDTISVVGEVVRAYVPPPLPPDPPLDLSRLARKLARADQAIGRLDGLSTLLPDPQLLVYLYVRKEALVSSQIEGTQSTLTDLLRYELDEAPGVPLADVAEVSNYVAALEHGLERLRVDDFPLSLRLIREIHGILLQGGRGSAQMPGEFRRSQNWIGGSRPGNALFVPPPAARLPELLGALEAFLHEDLQHVPILIKAALTHVQFETIHPFLDGNGRVGRLLITLLLCWDGVLREPMLYLSLYLKAHRARYYELLQAVRTRGVWEEWLDFFLDGVIETATSAVDAARRVRVLFEEDRLRIHQLGRLSSSALRVHDHVQRRPLTTIQLIRDQQELSVPTIGTALGSLEMLGVVHEVTGRRRDRVFVYRRYLDILAAGTEPLPR